MCKAFGERYHSSTKRPRFSLQLKAHNFCQFRNEEATDEAVFKKLAEIERSSCLDNDADQTDDGICDVLWKAVEGKPSALYAQTKDGIEFVYSKDF